MVWCRGKRSGATGCAWRKQRTTRRLPTTSPHRLAPFPMVCASEVISGAGPIRTTTSACCRQRGSRPSLIIGSVPTAAAKSRYPELLERPAAPPWSRSRPDKFRILCVPRALSWPDSLAASSRRRARPANKGRQAVVRPAIGTGVGMWGAIKTIALVASRLALLPMS